MLYFDSRSLVVTGDAIQGGAAESVYIKEVLQLQTAWSLKTLTRILASSLLPPSSSSSSGGQLEWDLFCFLEQGGINVRGSGMKWGAGHMTAV
ncbi:hypothetical protein J4Q44_G00129890 [Coregonus suidteri]|uniref:Uncharacterized protein n=1 Tax=Coregonus suidteri TaxID=861788 RepID=A0AAN8LXT6_9TELE